MTNDDLGRLPFGHPARRLFALDPEAAFLNNGSFGACPTRVLEAQDAIRREMERQPVAFFADILPVRLRAAAQRLAGFLGAAGDDIVFVENATAGMNAVLRSLRFARGDEILTTDHVYGAVRQVLRHLEATAGVVVVEPTLPWPVRDEAAVVEAVARGLTPRTRLLVIDHIASRSALILPVAKLVELAKAQGVPVLVDGAHAPGQVELDVPALGADWVIGNCHKWLFAPKGAAFLWARADRQAELHPPVISHGYGGGFVAEFDWVGTRDASAWLAVPDALDFLEALGPARVRERNHALVTAMAETLASAWRTEVGAARPLFGAMATVRMPAGLPPTWEAGRALRKRLWDTHRVEVPIMPVGDALWARLSAQIFNVPDDYARLARAVAAG
ncbi:MAG: aminotransferase class V-fold PLP-dependent enzyme [Alphaproteobacteria bacterium]|nr:aminotransferase class V-fold PLP-dependent enzyme [Alphaproteobacteria bacterium]